MKTIIRFSLPVLLLILFVFSCSQKHEKVSALVKEIETDLTQIDTSGESPSIFWVSDPVQPGEIVMLAGANWGQSPYVKLSYLRDKAPGKPLTGKVSVQKTVDVTPLQITKSSLKFLLPADWKEGVYSFLIVGDEAESLPVLVNAPEPWWQQGDWGKEASPGSWLRIFGKCLSLNGNASVALRRNNKTIILKPSQQDKWSLNVSLPAEIDAGNYETWVHNGCGGSSAWKLVGEVMIKEHPPLWKSDIFDIRDYGAIGNDEFDDGVAVQAALDAAGQNGGGIVLIPCGLFQINTTLKIPRLVLMRGEGSERSQLYWRDRINPLNALIRGSNSFGVEDLTIEASNHMSAIMSDPGTEPGAGNVFLRRLVVHINRFKQVKVHFAAGRVGSNWQRVDRSLSAVAVDGLNVQVTDCNIFSSHAPFRFSGNYGLFSNNYCFQGGSSAFIAGTQVIFENNVYEGSQMGRGSGDYVRKNLYFAHNRVGNMEFEDGELFTSDGHAGKREVTFASVEGTKITLGEDVEWYRLEGPEWTGNSTHEVVLSIVGGTGYGQYRVLKSFMGREVELESQWDVMPDSTSVISLSRCFKNNLIIDNDFHDGGWIQSYCMGIEWVFSENRIERCGGMQNKGHGISPSWFNQYIDNEIVAGGNLGSPPRASHLAVFGGVGARFTVFRHNKLNNNSMIATNMNRWDSKSGPATDVLIDHNIIKDTDIGISMAGRNTGVVIWGNSFEGIKKPIVGLNDGVFMHPAERILNLLSAEGLVPAKVQDTPAWKKALKQVESLLKVDPMSESLLDNVRDCQVELAKAALAALPEGMSLDLLQALTGLTIEESSSSMLKSVLDEGIGGSASFSIETKLPDWSIPVNLSLSFPPLPNWQVSDVEPVDLKPGSTVVSNVSITVPDGVWGSSTIPILCSVKATDLNIKGSGTIQLSANNHVKQWMVAGPFSSSRIAKWRLAFHEEQETVWDTLYPPVHLKDVNINSKYQGVGGMVRWQAVETNTVDFTKLYGPVKNGVAYAMAIIRVSKPAKVAITSGTASAMIYLDGEILGLPYHRWGHDLLSRTLSVGDHVLLCSVPQSLSPDNTINPWKLNLKVEVDPANSPGDVRIVSVNKIRDLALVAIK